MGNQICLRTHLHQPPHTILLDYRAHVQCWETGAIPLLSQASVTGVEPQNGIHLTLEDVKDRIVKEDNCMLPETLCVPLYGSILILSSASSFCTHSDCFPREQPKRLDIAFERCPRNLELCA
jgi:threonine aldolase